MPIAASLLLGLVVGWFMGSTDGDNIAVAVLPAVVSAGGLLLFPKLVTANVDELATVNILCLCIIVFVVFLYIGTNIGREVVAKVAKTKILEEVEKAQNNDYLIETYLTKKEIDLRLIYLETCTQAEIRINKGREYAGLEPLPVEYFCKSY